MMRRAATLVELVVFCTIVGIAAGIAIPKSRHVLDGLRLRQAAHEVSSALTLTRAAAIRRGERARLIVDSVAGSVQVESGQDTLLRRNLRDMHYVTLRSSRDTITYAPSGLGWGLANSTVIVSLRQRAETVTVSRLGRTRSSY